MIKQAILLAGGEGTRLRPFTCYTSKHLLPIYDKPMIFYPLKNLLLLGVETVFLVIKGAHRRQWESLFLSVDVGLEIVLVEQESPEGIPHAIVICEEFLNSQPFYLGLGDNILLGSGLLNRFKNAVKKNPNGAVIASYTVNNPEDFGVAVTDEFGNLQSIVEKPVEPLSDQAVVGLYAFGSDATSLAKGLKKSSRGEYEIADLINLYIQKGCCEILVCDTATDYWLDTGTIHGINSASSFIRELHLSGRKDIGSFE